MQVFFRFLAIAIFSIFVGSQITEGALLVPYWQSLEPADFYVYYKAFGPTIAQFYTVLTIVAALIPIVLTVYCRVTKSPGFKYALASSFLAILFVATFYIYFKEANEQFIQANLSDSELQKELITWASWHWGRIVVESISLLFLILAFMQMGSKNNL